MGGYPRWASEGRDPWHCLERLKRLCYRQAGDADKDSLLHQTLLPELFLNQASTFWTSAFSNFSKNCPPILHI